MDEMDLCIHTWIKVKTVMLWLNEGQKTNDEIRRETHTCRKGYSSGTQNFDYP